MADYSEMTDAEFDAILEELVVKYYGAGGWLLVMSYEAAREAVAEDMTNEVLDVWAERNPAKAYPEDCECHDAG